MVQMKNRIITDNTDRHTISNSPEFKGIKNEVLSNSFYLFAKKLIESMGAISLE